MQFSIQLLLIAMTVASLNAACGIFLLQHQMLTNSLLGFCNSGLFVFAVALQIAVFAFAAIRSSRKATIKRFLIAGCVIWLAMVVLTRMYAESVGRWLWDHQRMFATEWIPIEFIASLSALLGVPTFCMLSTLSSVFVWNAIRTNPVLRGSSGGTTTLHNQATLVNTIVRHSRNATKIRSSGLTFRLSAIFLLMAFVAIVLWWLTPSQEDRLSEKKLVGTWEVRLTASQSATTETRLVEYRENELVGIGGRIAKSCFGVVAKTHFWCVRNGMLIDGWRHTTPREFDYTITWVDDDNFVLEFIGLDGSCAKTYNRRVASQ
jgi:hypothetical protein